MSGSFGNKFNLLNTAVIVFLFFCFLFMNNSTFLPTVYSAALLCVRVRRWVRLYFHIILLFLFDLPGQKGVGTSLKMWDSSGDFGTVGVYVHA